MKSSAFKSEPVIRNLVIYGIIAASLGALIYANCADRWYWLAPMTFDAKRWKDVSSARSDERERFAKYLIQQKSLVGMTKSDIINKLGRPDSICYSDQLDASGLPNIHPVLEKSYRYRVGSPSRNLEVIFAGETVSSANILLTSGL